MRNYNSAQKSKKMNIMFCLGSMMKGGAERVVSQLANKFAEEGNDVSIVVTTLRTQGYKTNDRVKLLALEYGECNFIKRTFLRIVKLKKIIRRERPNVIIAFLPEPSLRVLLANLLNRKKIIVSVRNDPNAEFDSFFKRTVARILYKRSNGVVFQTEDARDWFQKSIQKKSTIILNPLSDEFLVQPFDGQRKKEIITVGRLVKQKNQRLLIDAFAVLNKRKPGYVLKIIGSGNMEQELKKYVDDEHLSNKITFLGEVQDVKKELYDAALFVLSSDYEGMPNALLEALAMGVPAVSTDCPCGGPKFLMQNYPMRALVKVNERKKLADCMEKMLSITDDERKKINNFASIIQEKTNNNRIIGEWRDYIEEVVND